MQPFSRHSGFFASLKQVEDRLAAEEQQEKPPGLIQPEAPPLFSDTMTASPLLLGASKATATDCGICSGGGGSSGPALDFLTLSKDEERAQDHQQDTNDDSDDGEDIAQLLALLGLSPPPRGGDDGRDSGGGCDCSGGDGFLAKVVGVVGPKCEKEKRMVEGWIEHYCGDGGGCREPARLAHLLLAKASWSWMEKGLRIEQPSCSLPPSRSSWTVTRHRGSPTTGNRGIQSDSTWTISFCNVDSVFQAQ